MHVTYRSKPSQARNHISGIETNVCSAERRIKSTCDAIANNTRPKATTNIAMFRRRSGLFRCLGYFHHKPEVGPHEDLGIVRLSSISPQWQLLGLAHKIIRHTQPEDIRENRTEYNQESNTNS